MITDEKTPLFPWLDSQLDLTRTRMQFVVMVAIVLAISGIYLHTTFANYQKMAKAEALTLADSLKAILPGDRIADVINDPAKDKGVVKRSLRQLVKTTHSINHAYIIGKTNGEAILIAHSSDDLLLNEQHNTKLTMINTLPFESKESLFAEPSKRHQNTFIRVLTPIMDLSEENVIAVLGLSFNKKEWQANLRTKMLSHVWMVISFLLLCLALFRLWLEHSGLKNQRRILLVHQQFYETIFETAPLGVVLVEHDTNTGISKFRNSNKAAERILGRDSNELATLQWNDLKDGQGDCSNLEQLESFFRGEIDNYAGERYLKRPDGSRIWIQVVVSAFTEKFSGNLIYVFVLEDISQRKDSEEALRESERSKAVLLAHLPGMAYRTRYDRFWTMEFASKGILALTGYLPENLLHNRDLSYNDMVAPEYRRLVWDEWRRCIQGRKSFRLEYELITKSGERKWVLELGQAVFDRQGEVIALEGIVLDITDQKKRQATIEHLRQHDFLTDLFNRHYLEKAQIRLDQAANLPFSIMICDLNGLRMINDAYGHSEGDRLITTIAQLLEGLSRQDDILGRLSGGEFMFVLPNTDRSAAQSLATTIEDTVSSYNRTRNNPLYDISITIGFSTKENENQDLDEVLNMAQKHLQQRKLLNQQSSHHAIVSSVMATLYAKSQETEEHGQRLGFLCAQIGKKLHLEQKNLDELQLLSMLHDIGKIGIDDQILNKPGPLTPEEWEQMKRHPEIGHRIAMSTPHLEHIAPYILAHHERWDGAGYPRGLKGKSIPLIARILAVVDAFDAMTEDRVYRQAMSQEEALAEIKKNAGSQFDPYLVELFLQLFPSSTT